MGEGRFPVEPPVYILQAALLHALHIVEKYLTGGGADLLYIAIKAGSWRTNLALSKWFNRGTIGLESAAASDVIAS